MIDAADQRTIGQVLDLLGWRQGSIAFGEEYASIYTYIETTRMDLAQALRDKTHCAVLISQSCDIVADKDDAEPYVEFLVAMIVEGTPNPADTYLKSFRTFAIPLMTDGSYLAFKPWDRVQVPRAAIKIAGPSTTHVLAFESIRDLVKWLVTRFERAALPNAFNERLTHDKANAKLLKLLEKARYVTEIYVALNPRFVELESVDESYEIDIKFLCKASDHLDSEKIRETEDLVLEIEKLLNRLPGIEVVEARVRSEHQFSRDEMRTHDRWHWDDVSVRSTLKELSRGNDPVHSIRSELEGYGQSAKKRSHDSCVSH